MTAYTVANMAEVTGLTAHTLRYYEKESLLLNVPRDSAGRRYYGNDHLAAVKFISALRSTNMSIGTIKDYISLYRQGSHTGHKRMSILKKHEQSVIDHLAEVKISLQMIKKKIKHYEDILGE
ncbi:MAG: DNA-binding transcriptional MerR regulator [Pseudohongiellaceae bacterium]|jgi:DNA-binding transcriptional MerR regulator